MKVLNPTNWPSFLLITGTYLQDLYAALLLDQGNYVSLFIIYVCIFKTSFNV